MDSNQSQKSTDTIYIINTDYCKLELNLIQSDSENVQIVIHKMDPDRMEVGNNLEEAQRLFKHHQELISKFNYKKTQITEAIYRQHSLNLQTLWTDIEKQLDLRLKLLELSVKFHKSAEVFIEKVNRASKLFEDVSDAEVSNTDLGYALIEQHQKSKKEILESSLTTFEIGKELLAILKEMSLYNRGANSGKHATSSACFSIENLLELLNTKRLRIEDLWRQRKLKLEQCIQICYLRDEIKKTIEWIRTEGFKQLDDSKLGTNYKEAIELQESHFKFEKQYQKLIHDSVMKCLRTADQFIHTGLERADEAHSEAHVLLKEWEIFARKLDQRRKLLSIVVNFYKQTEQASERLIQIEREIKKEHEKIRRLSDQDADKVRKSSPNLEFTQRHADLSSKLAEISAPGLREGKMILEKCTSDNFEAKHVIKKVYEFTEQVNEIKNKLTNDIQNKLVQTVESETESKKLTEVMEFESKFSDMFSWITNIGESFLTQHRDMGLDIAYVSDYVDNHEQMEVDLKENESEYRKLRERGHFLLNTCNNQEEKSQIERNLDILEQKWNRLKLTVEQRILVATDYLEFIKIVNKFKNITIDLQELFKSLHEHMSQTCSKVDAIFEQHVQDKTRIFEQYYEELLQKGRKSINSLRKSDNEIVKLNSNHMISDIELIMNDATSQFENIRSHLEIWKEKVSSQKRFKEEWQEFLINARQLIKKTMMIEENFFPKVTGEFGNTLEMAQTYQKNLDEFMPTVKQISMDIEDCITRAEILSLNGDTQGQKDMIVNELTKIRTRFVARINEYKILLQMAIQFFHNYHKLEEIIKESEQKCLNTELPNDLQTAENMLKQHILERDNVVKLLNFTSGEGDEIVYRVRQQGVEADTSDTVRRLLTRTEEHKRSWERAWDEKQRALKKKLELCQIMIEKNQINRDLDMMFSEIDHKRSSLAHNYELAQINLKNFQDLTDNMKICSENISKWKQVVEITLQNMTIHNLDGSQERELRSSLTEIDTKWSRLNQALKDYHNLLLKSNEFYKMYDELEVWVQQKNQVYNRLILIKTELNDLKQIETSLNQINQNICDLREHYDSKIKYLTNLAVEVYGDLDGPSRMRHIVTKNVELMNNLIQLKDDVEEIREKNISQKNKISQIYHDSSLIETENPPDFVKKLESAVVLTGSKHLFECLAEGTLPFEVKWFKNGIEIENNQKYTLNSETKNLSLLISNASLEDNGLFSCRVTNDIGMAETSAFLKIKELVKPKGSAPLIVTPLESIQLNADANYTLECIISGEPEPEVTWFKDDIQIDSLHDDLRSSLRTSRFMNVRQLSITNANPDLHSGNYSCVARNEYGEASCSCGILVRRPVVRTIQVDSNRAPVIEEQLLSQYTVQEGKPIKMSCRYSAYPRVDVIWLRDNQPIDLNLMGLSKDFKIIIDIDSTSLEITEAYPDDSGAYSVVIRNNLGQARSSTQLFVKESSEEVAENLQDKIPNVLRHLKNVEIRQGSRVQMDLFAVGQPQPQIKWYQNDVEIRVSERVQIDQDGNKYTLVLNNCDLRDSGEYKAIVKNEYGETISQCRLNVLPNEIENNKPVFMESLKDINVIEGHDVCFKCKVTGYPQPEVKWFKNGVELIESSRVKMARQGDDYYLVLTDSISDDSGIIQSQALNLHGESSSYGRLTVIQEQQQQQSSELVSQIQIQKSGSPPEFKKLFYNKHVRIGEDLRIEAVIHGSPKPRIKWLFNNETPQIDNCRCIMAGDTYSFVIDNFQEKNLGCYSITAENQYGKATCSAEILFEGEEFQAQSTRSTLITEETHTHRINDHEISSQSRNIESRIHPETRDIASQFDMGLDMGSHFGYSFSQQSNNLVDYSTTLIKDVPAHFEPIELIINRDTSLNYGSGCHSSSSTYVKEINERFEPINLIFQKPNRAGSLPPMYTRQIHLGYTDTEDEYLMDRDYGKVKYYREVERRYSRPNFRPVELILDAASISDNRRYIRRDVSLPVNKTRSTRYTTSSSSNSKKKKIIESSFIYDDNNEYDMESQTSDFISDRDSRDSRYVKYVYSGSGMDSRSGSRGFQYEDERVIKVEQKLPAMEMTIDLKTAPVVEHQIKSISVYEGQTARLECVLTGKPTPTVKWYREGKEIEESENTRFTYDHNTGLATLIIRSVTYTDSAKYTCVARNAIGSCSSSAQITVKDSKPQKLTKTKSLLVQPTPQKFTQQNALTDTFYTSQLNNNKSCRTSTMLIPNQGQIPSLIPVYSHKSVQSFQKIIPQKAPTIRSRSSPEHNHEPIDSVKRLFKKFEPTHSQTSYSFSKTTIYNNQSPQIKPESNRPIVEEPITPDPVKHRHHFKIEDYNPIDDDDKSSEPRLIRRLPHLVKKKEGQQVKLEIEVAGHPEPLVQWFKDDLPIKNSPDTRLTSNQGVHTLIIPETFDEDSGLYKALITSPVSNTQLETTCQLAVEVHHEMSPPRTHSDSPIRRRYQVETEEITYEPQQQQRPRIESVKEISKNYLSHTEIKPQQDMVKMLPSKPRTSSTSKPITIQPVQKPHFTKHLQNTTANKGQTVVLNCIIQSAPDIDIKWYNNGHLIQPSTDITISFDETTGDCTLTITEVFPEDAGQYTIVVTNPAGSESSTCWLIVKEPTPQRNEIIQPIKSVSQKPAATPLNFGPIKSQKVEQQPVEIIRAYQKFPDHSLPKLIEPLKDIELVEGGQAFFECRFEGKPLNIQWYKNDKEIKNQFRYKVNFDDKTGIARLCIATVLEDDADVYTCRAFNSLGEAVTSAKLAHTEKPKDIRPRQSVDEVFEKPQEFNQPIPAKIIRGLKNESFKEDDFIVLKALIAGNPLPTIAWFKNNAPLVMSQRHTTHFDEGKKIASLKIKNSKPDDAGLYTLVIQNPYGSDTSSGQVMILNEDRPRLSSTHSQSTPLPYTPVQQQPQPPQTPKTPLPVQQPQTPRPIAPVQQQQQQPQTPKPVEEFKAPRVIKHLQPETTVNEDQPIVLSCMIEPGNPLANIIFLKNDQPLNASSRIKTSYNPNNGVASIKIDDANVYDSGAFKIRAENIAGRAETGGVVYVNKMAGIDTRPVVDPDAFRYLPQPVQPVSRPVEHKKQPKKPSESEEFLPPNFVVGLPANCKLHEGEAIKLNCQVEGYPKPTITWLKDGKSLPASLRFTTNYIIPTGVASLTVTSGLLTDCGNYTCVAENPAGKAYTTSQVWIKESAGIDTNPITNPDAFKYLNRPKQYESAEDSQTDEDVPLNRAKPPKVIHHLQNIKQLEGEPVSMACKIDGFPKPTLTWLKDGQPLVASTRFTTTYDINTGVARLKISDSILQDSGVYTVVAENKAGSDRTNGRLEIEKESGIDNNPIVNPNAFAYLNKPETPTPSRGRQDEEPVSPARIVVPLSNIHSIEGKPVRLVCRVEGQPIPSVIWYKNGSPLPASTRLNPNYDIKTGVVSLKINEAQMGDSGVYEVAVENPYGQDRTQSRITIDLSPAIDQNPIVDPKAFKYLNSPRSQAPTDTEDEPNKLSPPKVIVPLKDIRVPEGEPATFLAKITGYPIPNITWLHNNKPLFESSRYTSSYDHTTGLAMFKINGTQSNDLGTYTAIAENKVGRDSTTARLYLNQVSLVDTAPIVNPDAFKYLDKPSRKNEEPEDNNGPLRPPKFVVPFKNVNVEEGHCATLLAKLDGYPYPTVQWFKDGISLPASTRTLPNYDYNTGIVSLKISDTQLQDYGNYTALATNKVGQDQSHCCVLVKELPGVDNTPMVRPEAFKFLENPRPGQAKNEESVAYIPPRFIIPLNKSSIKEGETVVLASKVEGFPKPSITWFKDEQPLVASTRITIDYDYATGVVSLRIENANITDIGIYIAFAENEVGSDRTQGEINIEKISNIDSTPMVNPDAFRYLEHPHLDNRPKSLEDLENISPPKVIVPLSNVKLEEGETVILACKIEGYPRPKLTWFKNGLTLPAKTRYTLDYELSTNIATLRIDQAVRDDLGDYLVLAENPAGKDQTYCTVFIHELPGIDSTPMVNPEAFKFLEQVPERKKSLDDSEDLMPPIVIIPLQDLKLTEGEPVVLMCKIEGKPRPKLTWFKNSEPLPISTRHDLDYDNTNIALLKISNCQKNDLGDYLVQAENPCGKCETKCKVSIDILPNIDETPMINPEIFKNLEHVPNRIEPHDDETKLNFIPPHVIIPLQDVRITESEPIRLQCKVDGYPKPKITWFKNKEPVPASTRFTSDYDFNSCMATLFISDARPDDIGTYLMLAENIAGKDDSKCETYVLRTGKIDDRPLIDPKAFVNLERVPDNLNQDVPEILPEGKPPKFIIHLPVEIRVLNGEKVNLKCKVEGYPFPKLTWTRNEEPLMASTRFTTEYEPNTGDIQVNIEFVKGIDSGFYKCKADNEYGSDETYMTIIVVDVPGVDDRPQTINPDAFRLLDNPTNIPLEILDNEQTPQPPVVIIPLNDLVIIEQQPICLICKIYGNPKPKLTWYKNDEPIMASVRCDMDYNLSTYIATLNIKVTKPVDLGVYKCVGENIAGKCETKCQLFIEAVPNIDETAYVNPDSFKPLEYPHAQPVSYDSDDNGEKQPVLIVRPLEDRECFEGESVSFVCEVRGHPKPQIEWTKDGKPLPHALRLSFDYLINEGRALFNIDNVKLDDQAQYELTARNSSGVASTSAKLKVKQVATVDDTSYVNPDVFQQFELKKKPNLNQPIDNAQTPRLKIIEPLKDFNLVEGSQVVFSCTIDAYPKPEINWFKDDQPLMASQRYATYYDMNMGIVTLIIKSALLDDKGVYKCVVSNIAGTEDTQAKLSVQFVPNIDETSYINPNALRHLEPQPAQETDDDDKYKKPYFVKVPKNTEVRDGTTVRLDCLAFGRPDPTLTWYFNGEEIKKDPTHKCLVNEEGVNSLLISPATFPDTGTYKCVARNKVGEASFTVDLKVVDKDALIAPYFIEHLNNIVIPEGKDTSLSCTCSGTPVPTLTWEKDGKKLTPDKEYRIDINGGHSKLYIQNAQKSDEGWYQCTAISPAGSTITRTKVTVLPPGAIQTITPDLSKLIKQAPEPEVPGFVAALHKLKHVPSNKTPDERPKSPTEPLIGHNFGSIWSKDELEDEETVYNKDRPIPPKFKTHFKASLNLRERDATRFEAKLIPIGDPTMQLQWLRNGEPLRSASRYVIKYDFGLVSLDLLWTYPEDDGVYECVATNSCGQDKTRAELKCKGNRSIIYDSQLPDGMEGYLKIQEMEERIKMASIIKEEQPDEEAPEPSPPEIIMHLEDTKVDEGTLAKFMVKVTGYPKPRVSWFVNKTHCVTGSRFKLYFDGMIHYLDIPKVAKTDEGIVRVFAKNINGEVESSAQLKVNPKQDYRSVLRNAKTGEQSYKEEEVKITSSEISEEERKVLDRLPLLKPLQKQSKPADTRFGPKFTKTLEPAKVTEGVVVTLCVEFSANPNPEAIWYKDGFQMQSSEDFYIETTATKSTLRIREAFKSDSGMYQVKIFNEVAIAQTKAYLAVIPADLADLTPKILLDLKSVTCNSGDPVKFQSQAIGNPAPIITWYKDDEKLEMDQRVKEFVENDAFTLLIMESIAADSGCYEMVAENSYGKVYTRAYLTVLGDKEIKEPEPVEVIINENNVRSVPLSSKFSQPVIEQPLKDQTATEGQSVKFECVISNSEQATVEWFKEDKLIKQSKYFNMSINENKHELNILEAFAEDEGLYKCVVSNPAGKTSSSAHLKIIHLTEAPVFVKSIDNTEVDENKPVELGVQLKENHQAHVEWSHNGVLVKDGVNFQIDNPSPGVHVLRLKQARPKDAGTYTCRAFNSAGQIKCSAQLTIKSMLKGSSESKPISSVLSFKNKFEQK